MEVEKGQEVVEKKCPRHPDLLLSLYCPTCNDSLCEQCEHDTEHTTVSLSEIYAQQHSLQTRIQSLQEQIGNRIENVATTSEKVKVSGEQSLNELKTFFDGLRTILEQRQSQLSTNLSETIEQKLQSLDAEQTVLRRISTEVESNADSLSSLDDFPGLLARLDELKAYVDKITDEGQNEDFPILYPSYFKQIEDLLTKMGSVLSTTSTPYSVVASGEGLQYGCISKRTAILLEAKNATGEPVALEIMQIKGEILSQHSRVVCPMTVENVQMGVYHLFYELLREGSYFISISYYGNPIYGSPFTVRCISRDQYDMLNSSCSMHNRSPLPSTSRRHVPSGGGKSSSGSRHSHTPIDDDLLLKVGTPGRGKGQFTNLQGITCTDDGHVIVADSNNQNVQIFNEEGEFIMKFGSPGRGIGCLQRPTGVAIGPLGHILVADYDNKWVNVFSSQGKYRSRFGTGKLLGPKGVGVTGSGNIVVIDNKANALLIFDSTGHLIKKMGTSARTAKCSFAGPHYVGINNIERRMYVTDFHNHCVKVFGIQGRFLFQFGSNGEGNGQFNAPTGIGVDSNQNVLVSDWGNGRIQVFDKNGSFLSYVNISDGLYGPQGLAITPEDQVLVADTGNHCYKLYRYL